eukprot:m.32298 g.32298  ORF g.32298 m.32298 type:complete len:415 (-) comp14099_c0_seq1:966-2210(-)
MSGTVSAAEAPAQQKQQTLESACHVCERVSWLFVVPRDVPHRLAALAALCCIRNNSHGIHSSYTWAGVGGGLQSGSAGWHTIALSSRIQAQARIVVCSALHHRRSHWQQHCLPAERVLPRVRHPGVLQPLRHRITRSEAQRFPQQPSTRAAHFLLEPRGRVRARRPAAAAEGRPQHLSVARARVPQWRAVGRRHLAAAHAGDTRRRPTAPAASASSLRQPRALPGAHQRGSGQRAGGAVLGAGRRRGRRHSGSGTRPRQRVGLGGVPATWHLPRIADTGAARGQGARGRGAPPHHHCPHRGRFWPAAARHKSCRGHRGATAAGGRRSCDTARDAQRDKVGHGGCIRLVCVVDPNATRVRCRLASVCACRCQRVSPKLHLDQAGCLQLAAACRPTLPAKHVRSRSAQCAYLQHHG